MTSLIRDVLFPSAAALGLLCAAVTDSAMAEATTSPQPAVIAAASVAPVSLEPSSLPQDSSAKIEGDKKPAGIEGRCERTGRIGKFKITRCD